MVPTGYIATESVSVLSCCRQHIGCRNLASVVPKRSATLIAKVHLWLTKTKICCRPIAVVQPNRFSIFSWQVNAIVLFITARCTVVQSAVLRLHVVRPSVHLSVC